jgi:2-dehydro-3-deoxyphosphogluconate aldolase/(4S)-4-hydroxy-2-oxoglutarate aldolase
MSSEPRRATVQAIEDAGVVAVIRLHDAAAGRHVAAALAEGGITALEVTMTVPNAVQLIAELSASVSARVIIGAGTVLDAGTAVQVIDAGARFVVSPIFRSTVIDACHQRQTVAIPGCLTPTEIFQATEAGADIVKVFPATSLGPGYVKDLRGPLPRLRLMPTGGVTLENAGDWIRAGAVAVGVGSALVDQRDIASGRFDRIAERARLFVSAVRQAREQQEARA